MLYVFQVDTGTMLTFDMNLAMESVGKLQEMISKLCGISEDKQVLLISGGESLDPGARVCTYSAGTDTNPIFLFSKTTIEAATPPSASVNYGSEYDLRDQVEGSMNMAATYETIVVRTQLALQFHDTACEELKSCERLVYDQHLQHQGWAAVIANLEDITSAFKKRADLFRNNFDEYLLRRDHHLEVLSSFSETVTLLSRIPILPCLLPSYWEAAATSASTHQEAATSSSQQSQQSDPPSVQAVERGSVESSKTDASMSLSPGRRHSSLLPQPKCLLDWISAQDTRNTLDQMVQQCRQGLQQFDQPIRESLDEEVEAVLTDISNQSMKEVKGLEERLFGLEKLIVIARKIVQEQGDMSQGFVQNQTRARSLQDVSVLPDLCSSHQRQMIGMRDNHSKLHDVQRRCMLAKDELSTNLHTRLRWVMYIQKRILDVDSKLIIHHETLRKLKRRLEVASQMHSAPDVYCSAIVEVLRRKNFSQGFIQWTHNLCEEFTDLHQREMDTRKVFGRKIKHHFLKTLFPGFEDVPPEFASRPPKEFDDHLPAITKDDLQGLVTHVPELQEKLEFLECEPLGEHLSDVTVRHVSGTALDRLQTCTGTYSEESTPQSGRSRHATGDQFVKVEVTTSHEFCSAEMVHKEDIEKEEGLMHTTQQEENSSLGKDERDGLDVDGMGESIGQSVEVLHQDAENNLMFQISALGEKLDADPGPLSVPSLSDASVGTQTVIGGEQMLPKAQSTASIQTDASPTDIHPLRERRGTRTSGTPGTSPDMDEPFMTADFYIDESMPSSLTDSAPSKKIVELHQQLQERGVILETRDREIDDQKGVLQQLQSRVTMAEDNFKLLHDVAEKGALQLKCDLLSVEKQFQKDKDDLQGFMGKVTQKVVLLINNFEEQQAKNRKTDLQGLEEEHQKQLKNLEEKLEVEVQKSIDVQGEIDTYQFQLLEKDEQLDLLKTEHDKNISDMKKVHEEELQILQSQLTLEHEVELEKIKSDLDLEIMNKETEVSELETKLALLAAELEKLKKADENSEEEMLMKFQKEKDEIQQILEKDYQQKHEKHDLEMNKILSDEHAKNLKKLLAEQEEALLRSHEKLMQEMAEKNEQEISKIRAELEKTHNSAVADLRKNLDEEKLKALQELEEKSRSEQDDMLNQVRDEHQKLMESLEQKLVQAAVGSKKDVIKREEHGRVVSEMRDSFEQEKAVVIEQTEAELRAAHQQEVEKLQQQYKLDKEEALQALKLTCTGEKQVLFNEALSKAVAAKDETIVELEARQEQLVLELKNSQCEIKDLKVRGGAQVEARSLQGHLEEELATARQQILQLESEILSSPVGMGQSTMMGQSVSQSVMAIAEGSSLLGHDRLQQLEMTLQHKEAENTRLQRKIESLSMTTSSRMLVQDKVSITNCHVGDVVLLCLDERHDHYVVFTVGSMLHFLHSDCLEALGLKSGTAGETRKSWVLAEITDKEYCQAKKAQNRYKVPVGTKFYRVKARSWTRESSTQALQAQASQAQQALQQELPQASHSQDATHTEPSATLQSPNVDELSSIETKPTDSLGNR